MNIQTLVLISYYIYYLKNNHWYVITEEISTMWFKKKYYESHTYIAICNIAQIFKWL